MSSWSFCKKVGTHWQVYLQHCITFTATANPTGLIEYRVSGTVDAFTVPLILCWFKQAEIIIAMACGRRMTACCYTTQYRVFVPDEKKGYNGRCHSLWVWRDARGSALKTMLAVSTDIGGLALASVCKHHVLVTSGQEQRSRSNLQKCR